MRSKEEEDMTGSNARAGAATKAGEGEIVITRVFDAPRELVFKAWTEPERLRRWWGPNGMSPDWPEEALVTVTFAEQPGQTTFTLRHGWSESLDRLAGYLAKA
jgi:uncharacterized protein YndB with AHSA1/START domain